MIPLKKQIFLCTLGTALEWYDFSLFASMTAIFSQLFFPEVNASSAILFTFSVFAAGYITRPFGAIYFGHLGDRIGRKSSLLISILLMAVSTTIIGMLPVSTSFSMYLLVLCRLLQGFATSGEYGGGITMLYEQPTKRKGFISSFGLFSAILGISLGTAIVTITTKVLGNQNMLAWGWRIPFLLGAPLGILGFMLRKSLLESGEFLNAKANNTVCAIPIYRLFQEYKKELFALTAMYTLSNIAFYINFIYLGNQASLDNHMDTSTSLCISLFVTLIYACSILTFALLSDYVGRLKIMAISCVLLITLAVPLFNIILSGNVNLQLMGQVTISILLGMFVGPLAAVTAECFSINVRYSGIGIPLNLAASIFGGTTPLICAWLARLAGRQTMPAYYLMAASIIAMAAVYSLSRGTRQRSMRYLKIVNSV